MLFSAKFSSLEKRDSANGSYFIAHSSKFDKIGILFFPPKDENLCKFLDTLIADSERISNYVFKIAYRSFKTQNGVYKTYFNLVGYSPCDTAD